MIGQKRLLDKIDKWQELPRFLIFNGIKGIGKKTLAKEIASKFNCQLIIIGVKIDEIREMIKIANEFDTEIIFLIDEGNRMSLGAENTLLKVTEEAPNNTHIILSVENKDLLLPTIISRGEVFNFQDYNVEEHKQFVIENHLLPNDLIDNFIFDCLPSTYPSFYYYQLLDIIEAAKLRDLVYNLTEKTDLGLVDYYNLTQQIKLKDDQQGFDFFQFIYALKYRCNELLLVAAEKKLTDRYNMILSFIQNLTKAQKALCNPLLNKAYILDKIILDFKNFK